MSVTISVVIPAYNASKTISPCLNSLFSQTTPPDEIVVVDDGSQDNTLESVKGFGDAVTLISQSNQGSAGARETGSKAASSDYIAYLDADDWWPSERLESIRKLLEVEQIDFLIGDLQRARYGDSPDKYLPRNSTFFPWISNFLADNQASTSAPDLYRFSSDVALSILLRGFPVYPSTMVVRRAVLDVVGSWDVRFRRAQDFDMGLRISRRFPMHYYHNVQAILGLHEINQDANPYVIKQTQGDIKVLLAHYESEPRSSGYRICLAKALAGKYCGLAYTYRQEGQYLEARVGYWHAVKWPGRRMHSLLRWFILFFIRNK
jgi:glycosyltransferase involved in cell wall biosynthesis